MSRSPADRAAAAYAEQQARLSATDPVIGELIANNSRQRARDALVDELYEELRRAWGPFRDLEEAANWDRRPATLDEYAGRLAVLLAAAAKALSDAGMEDALRDRQDEWPAGRLARSLLREALRGEAEGKVAVKHAPEAGLAFNGLRAVWREIGHAYYTKLRESNEARVQSEFPDLAPPVADTSTPAAPASGPPGTDVRPAVPESDQVSGSDDPLEQLVRVAAAHKERAKLEHQRRTWCEAKYRERLAFAAAFNAVANYADPATPEEFAREWSKLVVTAVELMRTNNLSLPEPGLSDTGPPADLARKAIQATISKGVEGANAAARVVAETPVSRWAIKNHIGFIGGKLVDELERRDRTEAERLFPNLYPFRECAPASGQSADPEPTPPATITPIKPPQPHVSQNEGNPVPIDSHSGRAGSVGDEGGRRKPPADACVWSIPLYVYQWGEVFGVESRTTAAERLKELGDNAVQQPNGKHWVVNLAAIPLYRTSYDGVAGKILSDRDERVTKRNDRRKSQAKEKRKNAATEKPPTTAARN